MRGYPTTFNRDEYLSEFNYPEFGVIRQEGEK